MSKQINVSGIPGELRARPQWVCWYWDQREGKPTKVPMIAASGTNASSTDPATWTSFDAALASPYGDGIGFVVTASDPYCGVDIDHCVAEGVVAPLALSIIRRLDSYTEITVSGEGVRVWVKAKWPAPTGKKKKLTPPIEIEFYDQARFFTVTGDLVPGTQAEIHDRQEAIDAAYAKYWPPEVERPRREASLSLSDLDLLSRARAARNGDQFDRLWAGDTSGHGDDDSAADLALLCHLAFWTGRSSIQMERLFGQSGLGNRNKWQRQDYRQRSINRAIDLTPEVYTPGMPCQPQRETIVQVDPDASGLFRIRDFTEEIRDFYHNGAQRGDHPGWDSLAKLYRVQRGEWTVVTGMPSDGKTSFMDAMMLRLIDSAGWKFVICSPENQPLRRHFAHLASILNGQPFYGPDRMDYEAVEWAAKFLDEYVIFNLPEAPTIDAVLDNAERAVVEFGATGVLIDPFNTLEHSRPRGIDQSEYIGLCLMRFRKFARSKRVHLWLIAHPAKPEKRRRLNENGKPMIREGHEVWDYPVPTLYDISGSANFYNMADNGISVWRDRYGESNCVQVHVLKVKFRENGTPGVAELIYERQSRRFEDSGIFWEHGHERPIVRSSAVAIGRPRYADPDLPEASGELESNRRRIGVELESGDAAWQACVEAADVADEMRRWEAEQLAMGGIVRVDSGGEEPQKEGE